ncbi:MAG: hypothetical protein NC390_04805 [Fusobacterium sp.]|nr:hypothetical protein [Fusobacterium sp.]
MVVSGINNYNTAINFGAKTRSEREAEQKKSYTRMVNVVMPEEDLQILEMAKKRAHEKALEEQRKKAEAANKQRTEKQYREDVKELRETQSIIKDITGAGKDKNLFSGGTLKTIGNVADVVITGVLSGMALHWSTGKAFMMIHKFINKPKVANFLGNVKKPFSIVGSGIKKGASTAWSTMAREVKATEKGKKLLETKPMQFLNKCLNDASKSYNNLKTDAKNLTAENIKSTISTIFGVSGFVAGAVEKLDKNPQSQKKDN